MRRFAEAVAGEGTRSSHQVGDGTKIHKLIRVIRKEAIMTDLT